KRHLPGVHHLGDHGHAVLVADVAEDLEPLLAHSLERVRTGPGLEGPAPEDVRPRLFHVAGDAVEALEALDGARPRDHRQMPAADLDLANVNYRVGPVEFAAGQLERLEDAVDILDARDRVQLLDTWGVVVADQGDDGAERPGDDPGLEPELDYALDDVIDLRLGGVGAED